MSNAVVCQSRLGVSLFRFISLLEIRHLRPRPLSGAARTGGLHSAQTHYVRLRESQRFKQIDRTSYLRGNYVVETVAMNAGSARKQMA